MAELTTVADDEAVIHDGAEARTYRDLEPDTDHELEGFELRTLPRLGDRLATVTTVNDVHFGETVCGIMDGIPDGPFFSVEEGAEPYPELMNRGAIAEMAAVDPDAVVVKGDLTCDGLDEEYAAFLQAYGTAFGDRLHHVRGNHDAYRHQTYAPEGPAADRRRRAHDRAARHHHPGPHHRPGARRRRWSGWKTWPPAPTGRCS